MEPLFVKDSERDFFVGILLAAFVDAVDVVAFGGEGGVGGRAGVEGL